MTLVPITCYRCSDCNRLYEEDPERCVCERSVFVKDSVHGSFIVRDKAEKPTYYLVTCILCGSTKEIRYSNIRRQDSCGCKPRSAIISEITPEKVMYTCRKCGESHILVPPIVSYCCED